MIPRSKLVSRAYLNHIRSSTLVPRSHRRNLQSETPINTDKVGEEQKENLENETANVSETVEHDSSIPWYLREDASSQIRTVEVELPEVPEHAPATVADFLHVVGQEYGMSDIKLYDLSELPEDHTYSVTNQPFKYIIICSGKSEKHIYKAASELRYRIKHERGYLPSMEGRVSSALNALARRRLMKRAGKGPAATDNEFGLGKNSWVMCDTGVDGIVVHMLTPDRREHLKLESLWSEQEDNVSTESSIDSDSIFRGFRRRFHTSTRCFNGNKLKEIYDLLLVQESPKSLQSLKQEFDLSFKGLNIQEYNIKYDFYKSLHLLDPEAVTEPDLLRIVWDKYSSLSLVCDNWKQEITHDVIKYMELLVDSPIASHEEPAEKYNKLSKFISQITQFSNEEVNLLSNPQFQSLLWRLSYNGSNEVDAATVSEIIQTGQPTETTYSEYLVLDEKKSRDAWTFIEQCYHKSGTPVPVWFREQKMYTYGNCGKWTEFWNEWDVIVQTVPTEHVLGYWVKLLVYLTERNTIEELRNFFVTYWNQPQRMGYSFIADYIKHGEQFTTKEEKHAIKSAINKLASECSTFPWFQPASDFASKL
ncbi:uncharacterized protein SPAPADRAFT_59743 [Spathaspora passalidarum NRRL Y-27907]|uniref:ATPase synthesis protein 25 n=1 Tax=Spathaspora passalidarum (strain NRRL Y-27907 / 11-Y1) TaxID=619300 RepID=G3AI15_SPAPN|nr:uncharacterized protein SPAPADRAFT_59743 [Spathaspora passalidarum NRRL Y-27907]EGW34329.1 hypothetical protein SPAPADRAFT_59743 [Spathaspora passalidarum NRRL Y-27907]